MAGDVGGYLSRMVRSGGAVIQRATGVERARERGWSPGPDRRKEGLEKLDSQFIIANARLPSLFVLFVRGCSGVRTHPPPVVADAYVGTLASGARRAPHPGLI